MATIFIILMIAFTDGSTQMLSLEDDQRYRTVKACVAAAQELVEGIAAHDDVVEVRGLCVRRKGDQGA